MFYIERNGKRVSRPLGGPRRLSDVLSREEYIAVLNGELAPFSRLRLGGGMDLGSIVEEGEVIVLRTVQDPAEQTVAEQTAILSLTDRVLAETTAPAWLVDLVEQGRADALQADRAKVAGSCEPWGDFLAVLWTKSKRWFHHGEMPRGFDLAAHGAAVRLLAKLDRPKARIVFTPLPLPISGLFSTYTEEDRQALATLFSNVSGLRGDTQPSSVTADDSNNTSPQKSS